MKESYDKIKDTVSEVFKMIEGLLHESKVDKLAKTIDEDLTIIHKKEWKVWGRVKGRDKGRDKGRAKRRTKGKERFLKATRYF